jgi:hypothetical protein
MVRRELEFASVDEISLIELCADWASESCRFVWLNGPGLQGIESIMCVIRDLAS